MPKQLEEKLKKQAKKLVKKKKLTNEQVGAYIYGTLRKTGWKPKKEK